MNEHSNNSLIKSSSNADELVIVLNEAENERELGAEEMYKYRTCLPSPMLDRSKISIWSIMRQCVDKELYRFTIPILWNEPLSLLQRSAESMRYSNELLEKAADSPDPVDRLKYIAAFIVSTQSIQVGRVSKPFNPLLGETFEFTSLTDRLRICCEQVSHHPPISAFHAESLTPTQNATPKWIYYGSTYPHLKLNILNGCIEATPIGLMTLEIPEYNEVYTWNGLRIFAHNLILGKLWFEFTGNIEIINHKLNLKCQMNFKPYSWFTRQMNRFEGHILDSNENKLALVYGKWDQCFYATNDTQNENQLGKKVEKLLHNNNTSRRDSANDIQLIWNCEKPINLHSAGAFDKYFNFNDYTFSLNELHSDLTKNSSFTLKNKSKKTTKSITLGPIAPTDSRYRPDMRLYEEGKVEEASNQKHLLEEKQREKQRKMEADEIEKWKPLWFEMNAHNERKEEQVWIFKNSYWKREFGDCPDIYLSNNS